MAFKKLGILFRLGIVLAIVGFSGLAARAQGVGSVDPTFTPSIELNDGTVVRTLFSSTVQPDGKILVSGDFALANGVTRPGLVRLNADGTVDPSFTGVDVGFVFGITVQADGKILIAGSFTSVNGVARACFARLNADGSPDTAFNAGAGFTGFGGPAAQKALIQPDGRYLVFGDFNRYNGVSCSQIVRINLDGTLDASFDSTGNNVIQPGGRVNDAALQPDGKVVVVGSFASLTTPVRTGITRLNPDGSTDATFAPGTGIRTGTAVAVQADGKIVVGGFLLAVNDAPRIGLARLLANGALDTTFTTDVSGTGANVTSLAIYGDGRILVGGQFETIGGVVRTGLARLASDGIPDPAFNPVLATGQAGVAPRLGKITLQVDGQAIIVGNFASIGGIARSGIARLNEIAVPDDQFHPRFGVSGIVLATALQSDGRILVGGNFALVNGAPRRGIARLNVGGGIDDTFQPGTGIGITTNTGLDPFVNAIIAQPDGRILIGGFFDRVNDIPRRFLARLNADGSLDTAFAPDIPQGSTIPTVRGVAVQADGRIIVVGDFSTVNGTPRARVARLNADGSLDASFNPGTGVTATSSQPVVNAVGLGGDGKIVIAGFFERYNGVVRNSVARLNADGSLDTSFDVGSGPVGEVAALTVLPDGRVVIGGSFATVAGVTRRALARLNVNGTLDPTFADPGITNEQGQTFRMVTGLSVLPGGRIVIGGAFTIVGGTASRSVARINTDGSLDTTFNTGAGANGTVLSFVLDESGNIVIGGNFTAVNNIGRPALARLIGDTPSGCTYALSASGATFPIGGGTGSVTIVTGAGCPWQTTNVPSWITGLTLSGVGTTTLNYTVAANTGPARTATLLIGGVVYTVAQADGCVRTLSATSANFDPIGGTGSVTLTTDAICPWTVTGVPFWISGIPTSGVGTRTFTFTVARLTAGGSRSAIIQFGGQPFTVTQSGCAYTVSPTTIPISTSGGITAISVTSSSGCPWTAASTVPWITIVSGVRGTGNGTVQIEIAPGSGRSGTFTVAGQTVRVVQGQPAFSISTCGQFRPTTGFVYLRNSNTSGFAENEFFYGQAGDQPLAGDWNGDGTDTIGIYRNGTFFLRNSNNSGFADIQFPFGAPGDIAIVGDWNGDGIDTVGIIRGNAVFLRNTNTAGNADLQFNYGTETDIFIVGDWNGDGIDTIGAFRPSNGFVYLRNSNATGVADLEFFYGQAGDRPVVGDWNGDGVDTIGVVRGNQWFLRNSNSSGFADIEFAYGTDTDIPIVGNWDGLP